MSSRRTRGSKSRNARLFKASLTQKREEEGEKFNFTASFMPEQLDFSAYLENVKSQSKELEAESNKDNATPEAKEKVPERVVEATPTPQFMKPQRLVLVN